MSIWRRFAVFATVCIALANSSPKYDMGGFIPSTGEYLQKSSKAQDQLAMATETRNAEEAQLATKRNSAETNDISDRNQEPRFGFTNVGGTGSGYGVSTYAPTKIDLGGVLLGAIIGIGSILVIPKLLYILSGSYGAYARSDEGGLTQAMTRLDDVLARNGIDTTSCMQRAVCTYAQDAALSTRESDDLEGEEVSSFDKMVNAITTNQVFKTAMQGTAIQEAVEAGRGGQKCSKVYPHCGFSLESTLSLLATLATSFSAPSRISSPAAS
ncbi:uncharacterized protein LOC105697258 [Orussus abietinus]|uniref:uncharacterized protein LOC105697258 n=1 Tax=Orussus abietinus TaxID=222816 RepID=UPI0006261440|nr:uncharacterized protein LOC105697258 [Orussus abietinus]XP_012275840.1 uncharacterized protein LOC105697258 [Orussus abietinus]